MTLVVFICVLLFSETASACVCRKKESPYDSYLSVNFVFEGKVIASKSVRPGMNQLTTFEVVRNYKNALPEQVEVLSVGGDCATTFAKGARYIVYTSFNDFSLVTSMCARNIRIEEAKEDIAVLEKISKMKTTLNDLAEIRATNPLEDRERVSNEACGVDGKIADGEFETAQWLGACEVGGHVVQVIGSSAPCRRGTREYAQLLEFWDENEDRRLAWPIDNIWRYHLEGEFPKSCRLIRSQNIMATGTDWVHKVGFEDPANTLVIDFTKMTKPFFLNGIERRLPDW